MKSIKVPFTDEQFAEIKELSEQNGVSMASIIKFRLYPIDNNHLSKKLIQNIKLKEDKQLVKEKLTSLDKLMQEYIDSNPHAKVFIKNNMIVVQHRQTGGYENFSIPADIEGDFKKYPEGEPIPIVEIKREDLSEFDFMKKDRE